jgi:phage terminase large subunit-like protein
VGTPRLGDACGEWFRDIVRAAFGSVDPETGERAIAEIFCLVPKKNSKTTNSAALGITALLANKTPNALFLEVGPTKDVADPCVSQARGMIEADPVDPETGRSYLQDRFHVRDHLKTIRDRLTGATLEIKAFDMRVVTGAIPKLTIIDELHVLGSSPHAQAVLAQIRGGMITRPDALLLFITTQSDGPPAGVFKIELAYARRVRDGQVKGDGVNVLAVLYEFPEEIQRDPNRPWLDPKLWPMVLPNLGKSITLPRLKSLFDKAQEKGEAEIIRWASQHLNIQVGLGLFNDRWVGADLWPSAARPLSLEDILAQSDVVTLGIDGGGLDDLLGLGLIGRHAETRRWHGWARAWAQPDVLDRRKDIATVLMDFEAEGDLVICKTPSQDLSEIAALCAKIRAEGVLPDAAGIGLDPYGVAALVDELAANDLEGDLLAAIPQGARLSPAIWGLERKLADGTFCHADQPLLTWSVGNARTEQRGNAVLITKQISGKSKIDPLMGIFNAATLMARNPEVTQEAVSPWEDPNFSLMGGR